MRVAIDIRKLHDYGIGTYVRNLIRELARLDDTTEYVLFCRKDDLEQIASLGPNFTGLVQSASNYSVTEQLSIPTSIWSSGATLFRTPNLHTLSIYCHYPRLHTLTVSAVFTK